MDGIINRRQLNQKTEGKSNMNSRTYSRLRCAEIPQGQRQFLESFTSDVKAMSFFDWFKFWIKVWLKYSIPLAFNHSNTQANYRDQTFAASTTEKLVESMRDSITKVLAESTGVSAKSSTTENHRRVENWLIRKFKLTMQQLELLFTGTVDTLTIKCAGNDQENLKFS